MSDVALSDRFCVFFENNISVVTNVQIEVVYITENTGDRLI